MSSKEDLIKAVQRKKAQLESAADERNRRKLRLEKDSLEFTQRAIGFVYAVNQGIDSTQAAEQLTGPDGITVRLTYPQIDVLGHSIRLAPKLNNNQLCFMLSDLGDTEYGHIVRKEGEEWKVFQISGNVYVSHFTEEFLIDRLIRLINSF